MDLLVVLGLLKAIAVAVLFGGLSAAVAALYLAIQRPRLVELGARPAALHISALLIAAVPVLMAIGSLRPGWPVLFLTAGALAGIPLALLPKPLIVLTGGKRERPHQPLLDDLDAADDARAAGDFLSWRATLSGLQRHRTYSTAELVDVAGRIAETDPFSGPSPESVATSTRFRELRDAVAGIRRTRPVTIVAASALALLVAAVPVGVAVARSDACLGAFLLMGGEPSPGGPPVGDVSALIPASLDPGAEAIFTAVFDRRAAAESRHDPGTEAQLTSAGFVTAFQRGWAFASGRQISADVFVFGDQRGALQYHRAVSLYACGFANEAFDPGWPTAVGLQVRYRRGDPILEQIAWVEGSMRFVVARSYLEAPSDHDEILTLAAGVRGQP